MKAVLVSLAIFSSLFVRAASLPVSCENYPGRYLNPAAYNTYLDAIAEYKSRQTDNKQPFSQAIQRCIYINSQKEAAALTIHSNTIILVGSDLAANPQAYLKVNREINQQYNVLLAVVPDVPDRVQHYRMDFNSTLAPGMPMSKNAADNGVGNVFCQL